MGAHHEKPPPETEQFGRLVGLWHVEVEIARKGGGWEPSSPGLWAWKYALGGFAVTDLWYQPAGNLPDYMASLGRDYPLSAQRIFDVGAGKWRIAWMANGAGAVMGADFGRFSAELQCDDIVMISTGATAASQRIVFSEMTGDSFRWRIAHPSPSRRARCCLPRKEIRRLRFNRIFRGSISWPACSLCTLRSRGRPRTTQHSVPVSG